MRVTALLCCAALAVGCAPAEEQPATDTEAAPMVSLADYAGTWTVNAMSTMSDSVLTTFDLVATDGMQGWSMNPPDRDPIPLRVVSHAGDSVVFEAGPYASLLRDNVMVTLHTVTRLESGMMVGTFTARYSTETADSVLNGRLQGMKQTPQE